MLEFKLWVLFQKGNVLNLRVDLILKVDLGHQEGAQRDEEES